MHQTKSTAIIYGILHFLVDFCCAFFMFSVSTRITDFYVGYLIYNFLAFAMQMPVGLLADRLKQNVYTAMAGCFMILAALTLVSFRGFSGEQVVLWGGLSLIGIGNCLFHVGGGIEVMKQSRGKAAPLGIFVSPGAIGIYLGTLLGKQNRISVWWPVLLLAAATFLLLLKGRQYAEIPESHEELKETEKPLWGPGALCCFFLVVVLRSYLGMTAVFPWKDTLFEGVLCLAAVFGGKFTGGFLADKFGVKRAAEASLFLSAVLFGFSDFVWGGLPALFFFNMSMPMTLYLASKVCRGHHGFAFGLLTFAIFIGFLPVYGGCGGSSGWMLALPAAVSLLFMEAGIWFWTKKVPETKSGGGLK